MTNRGTRLGFTVDPTDQNLALMESWGWQYARYAPEWPWYQPSQASPIDFTEIDAGLARIHNRGRGCVLVFLGVPSWVNPNANGTTDGGWHRFATNAPGRALVATAAVAFAQRLDPARDWLHVRNEVNNVADFNKDNQSPAVVAAETAEIILAVRAACPTVRIIGPSLAAVGDLANPATNAYAMSIWGDQMLAADARLLTTAAPDVWSSSSYSWRPGLTDVDASDPLSTHGWNGHVQAAAWRAALASRGSSVKIAVMEHGAPSTPGPDYDEDWQALSTLHSHTAIDNGIAAGTYAVEPEILHTLVDISATVDAGHEFGIFRHDLTPKLSALVMIGRARELIAGTTNPPPPLPPATPLGIDLGSHFGITMTGAALTDLDYIAATGAHWARVLWSNTADPAPLADFVAHAHKLKLRVLIASRPATFDVATAADEALAYATLAGLGIDALEIGYKLNDPTVNPALLADPHHDYVRLTAELALAAAGRINQRIPLLTASLNPTATIGSRIPHNAIARLASQYGRRLAAAHLRLGTIITTPNGTNPETASSDPATNPSWHLREHGAP